MEDRDSRAYKYRKGKHTETLPATWWALMQFSFGPTSTSPHPPKGLTPPHSLDLALPSMVEAADPTGKLGTKAASTRPTTSFLSPTRDRSEATTPSMFARTEKPPVPLPAKSTLPTALRTCGDSGRHERGVLFGRIDTWAYSALGWFLPISFLVSGLYI
jgi:hypothetical protein